MGTKGNEQGSGGCGCSYTRASKEILVGMEMFCDILSVSVCWLPCYSRFSQEAILVSCEAYKGFQN